MLQPLPAPSPQRPLPPPLRRPHAGRQRPPRADRRHAAAARPGSQCRLWLCGFADVSNVSAMTTAQLQAWGEEPFTEWLGPTDAMEQVLAQVNCVVLPSYREGLPRSLLEAGATGLPVVVTDVSGCRHVVQHGVNGLLCEVRDAVALEQAMGAMVVMAAGERAVMGAAGRRVVEEGFGEGMVVEAAVAAVRRVSRRGRCGLGLGEVGWF
ncbi:glycosyltransferase [Kineobactrum sediminis]|uniref:glycosyltransferase n=1 Tax=Kineobactrum sediminis TaxID=1905677 RepID=UPI001390413F